MLDFQTASDIGKGGNSLWRRRGSECVWRSGGRTGSSGGLGRPSSLGLSFAHARFAYAYLVFPSFLLFLVFFLVFFMVMFSTVFTTSFFY